MKGASKVIMGATLVMVVSLAIVLALILVLLAELYCSLLLRSRRRPPAHLKDSTANSSITNTLTTATSTTPTNTTTTSTSTSSSFPSQDNQDQYSTRTSPLSSFYAQGVLQAPRNFLFPAPLPCKQKESNTSPPQISTLLSPTCASPSASFATSPVDPVQEISIQVAAGGGGGCKEKDNFVYISNPIYDNERNSRADTPFETPDTSPSRLGNSGYTSSSGDDGDDVVVRVVYSPPLSPMKKLPAQACSVSLSLGDATSLGTSGSDSNTNNCPSSSSSASPSASPSCFSIAGVANGSAI